MRSRRAGKLPAIPVSRVRGGAEIRVEGLTWRPVRRRTPVLRDLDLIVPAGQRVLVTGPSGAGKSTLLRALAGLLQSGGAGDLSGHVRIGGSPVGLLLQDPTAGVVAETVGRDVAFGPENSGMPRPEIWRRVDAALAAVRFPYGVGHPTAALSGGETQRLLLAGTLALDSPVLLLDEPTSMLDATAAATVRALLQDVITSRSCTAVIVEHRLEPWIGFGDRLLVLDSDGRLVADGSPEAVLARDGATLVRNGVWVPGAEAPQLLPVDPGLVATAAAPTPDRTNARELVRAHDVTVELTRRIGGRVAGVTRALDSVSATLLSGHVLALTGPSGAGKSTLAAVLAGLQRPTSGRLCSAAALATRRGAEPWRWRSRDLAARLAWVPQHPEHGIVASSVLDEVLATSRACGRDLTTARDRALAWLETLSLSALADASPYHLSGGEQRRLLLAAALTHGPSGLLLDEPTVGQDRHTWAAVLGSVRAARDAGVAVAVATHDELAVATLADAELQLVGGRAAA